MRERTRDGRRETRPTAADRLAAKLATQRGEPLSGGDVARLPAEARRRLLMRLGFLSGRASADELRAALAGTEEPPRPATARGRGRSDESAGDTRSVGRPAVAGEPRDVVVRLRATETERDAWQAAAERAGLPLSEWVRRALEAAGRMRGG